MTHEKRISDSIEWFTPPMVFERMAETFDMDVCSPMAGPVPWVPATVFLSARENGLVTPWSGFVWCNPPFGELARRFAERMVAHGDGVILLPARTDTRFFQYAAPEASAIAFIRERLYFIRSDGRQDRSPFASVLLGFGARAQGALVRADFGYTITGNGMTAVLWRAAGS